MIPTHLLPLTVTWLRAGTTTDGYGEPNADWDSATATEIRAWIEQQATSEQHGPGRDEIRATSLFITNELGVSALDRIRRDGQLFELAGAPAVIETPAGPHHLEAQLVAVEG